MGIADKNRCGVNCLLTSRLHPKADAEELVKSGLVDRRDCVKVDGDGFREGAEVWKVGYELTQLGRDWLSEMRPGPDGYQAD